VPDEMIRAVTHPQGDWYVVSVHHDHDKGDRWFIDRVVLWALRSGDKIVDHVVAVGSSGLPETEDSSDRFFALGDRLVPGRADLERCVPQRSPFTRHGP
jgi:exoribonuclease II